MYIYYDVPSPSSPITKLRMEKHIKNEKRRQVMGERLFVILHIILFFLCKFLLPLPNIKKPNETKYIYISNIYILVLIIITYMYVWCDII